MTLTCSLEQLCSWVKWTLRRASIVNSHVMGVPSLHGRNSSATWDAEVLLHRAISSFLPFFSATSSSTFRPMFRCPNLARFSMIFGLKHLIIFVKDGQNQNDSNYVTSPPKMSSTRLYIWNKMIIRQINTPKIIKTGNSLGNRRST